MKTREAIRVARVMPVTRVTCEMTERNRRGMRRCTDSVVCVVAHQPE